MMTTDESNPSVTAGTYGHEPGAAPPRRRAAIVIWVRLLLFLTAIGLCIAGNGCVASGTVCYHVSSADCAFDATIAVTDARFATDDKNGQPSRDFWIAKGERLNVSWEEYAVLMQRRGAPPCNFDADPFDLENCRKCPFCSDAEADLAKCGSAFNFSSTSLPTLVTYENFMSTATAASQLPQNLCRNPDGQGEGGIHLMPDTNQTVQLKAVGEDEKPIVEGRVFVIAAGASQTVTYQLSPFPAPAPGPAPSPGASPTPTPQVVFYAGSIPRDPILADSYSSSLHITKVRVLKGKVEPDPNTGKLRLIEKDGTAPAPQRSRLVFVPAASLTLRTDGNLQNDTQRCYRFPLDNNLFDLRECHHDPADSANYPLEATPEHLDSADMDPLTWVAEFRVSEGAVIPTLDADEVMVIEFTIEVR
jgi:hypothetical protein